MKLNLNKFRNKAISATVKVLDKAKYTTPVHPLDDPKFREWLHEQDGDATADFTYGIYDSRWTELHENYLEESKESDNA